jgi:tRNA modification GTPase
VIAGAPNVGKSTLVNVLAGFQRSIVSPIPGTTRDLVSTLIAIDGWPIELIDTAGWRSAATPLEQEGIVRGKLAAGDADLCLWLVDASAAPVLPEDRSFRVVINKIDLPNAWEHPADAVRISAHTGQGLDQLCQQISTWLVPAPPQQGEAVPFTPAVAEQVEKARLQEFRLPAPC